MVTAESWFRSLWKTQRKDDPNSEKAVIGVLAFEAAKLMSKLVNVWQSLSDKQVAKLRDEISNSVGIKKLVSDDDNFIVRLISQEMLESMAYVAESVARLAKKCSDTRLKDFEKAFDRFITRGFDSYGWVLSFKKMDKKVKRMEKFVSINANLYQEMEMLTDLEQTLKRMKAYSESDGPNLIEYQKQVAWKRLEVKNLQSNSLWNRTYDYTVYFLARSLFTIFSRINNVFGIHEVTNVGKTTDRNADRIHGSHSVSELLQPSVQPLPNNVARFSSGPLGPSTAKSNQNVRANKTSIFQPVGESSTKSGPISGKYKGLNFFSGPLGRSSKKPVPENGTSKNNKFWKFNNGHSSTASGKENNTRHSRATQVEPFKGCIAADSSSVINGRLNPNDVLVETKNHKEADSELHTQENAAHCSQPTFSSLCKLKPPSESLGAASLALHYAHVIVVIEKLAASPHLIGLDAKDDLYNMLPRRVKASLRTKLKPYSKGMAAAVYDASIAEEWTEAMTKALEWLAPLAHNMLRWQSERSYEQLSFVSRTNVLLVQTLYFASQEKTEEIITELLVGLNYVWRYVKELNTGMLEIGNSVVNNGYSIMNA
ncbi:protein PSK SIMULATOR 3-like [Vicia villosa]|uniref:protein PSK SIMULATOR 3-like n=1 Tax=Vicia villosa TaxID=3911 RepID=UPI00273CCB8A|nr:protein PSK SIMULATOR 3-like [Vicia villosa]